MSNFIGMLDVYVTLGSLYEALNSQTTQVLDLSDLLRSQLVMIVSALISTFMSSLD